LSKFRVPHKHSAERHWRPLGAGCDDLQHFLFPSNTQPKGIGDCPGPTVRFCVGAFPSNTQPKGIGDLIIPSFHLLFICVPLKHSAERHWRPNEVSPTLRPDIVPHKHSAERHWRRIHTSSSAWCAASRMFPTNTQPKGIGDPRVNGRTSAEWIVEVPHKHSAERHWRRAFVDHALRRLFSGRILLSWTAVAGHRFGFSHRRALFPSQAPSSRSTPRPPHFHKTSWVTAALGRSPTLRVFA
jgi:hypothetical protein